MSPFGTAAYAVRLPQGGGAVSARGVISLHLCACARSCYILSTKILQREDILSGPHSLKGLFKGEELGLKVRVKVRQLAVI